MINYNFNNQQNQLNYNYPKQVQIQQINNNNITKNTDNLINFNNNKYFNNISLNGNSRNNFKTDKIYNNMNLNSNMSFIDKNLFISFYKYKDYYKSNRFKEYDDKRKMEIHLNKITSQTLNAISLYKKMFEFQEEYFKNKNFDIQQKIGYYKNAILQKTSSYIDTIYRKIGYNIKNYNEIYENSNEIILSEFKLNLLETIENDKFKENYSNQNERLSHYLLHLKMLYMFTDMIEKGHEFPNIINLKYILKRSNLMVRNRSNKKKINSMEDVEINYMKPEEDYLIQLFSVMIKKFNNGNNYEKLIAKCFSKLLETASIGLDMKSLGIIARKSKQKTPSPNKYQ